MSSAHVEDFGPDLGRGPFAASSLEMAIIQIAAALAQLRSPLRADDGDIAGHADFVRTLADRLAPDWDAPATIDVGNIDGLLRIPTSIRTEIGTVSLLHCWVTDQYGDGAEATRAPDVVTWNVGTVLQEITTRRRYLILTNAAGIAQVTVQDGGMDNWRWAVARSGHVHYSSTLYFA
ncbi:MAG: hypothetical protein KKB50_06860 [Planctomycetes bacterium]|nr:hypothetical protein [Planctomycetota bacterium]